MTVSQDCSDDEGSVEVVRSELDLSGKERIGRDREE
jgi:hypothetical protein